MNLLKMHSPGVTRSNPAVAAPWPAPLPMLHPGPTLRVQGAPAWSPVLLGRRRAGAYRFRPVRADDADRFQAFVMRLSPAARRLRFHGAVKACSPALLKALTQPDPALHQAWVAVRHGAGEELIVGEGRFVASEGGSEAELAIAVADDHCGQGIGDRLLHTVLAGAARADVPVLFADVLEGNSRMFALLQRHGFEAGYSTHIAAGLVRWRRRLQPFGAGPLR